MREEPCLMCGGLIQADPANPAAEVLAHIRTTRHQRARGLTETRRCESCRMVTIPSWRILCHGCRRTEALAA